MSSFLPKDIYYIYLVLFLMQRNVYAKNQMKQTDWKREKTKDNTYYSTCKHTNLKKKDGSGKLIWNLSAILYVIKYRSSNWDINIWKLHAPFEWTKILRGENVF